MSVPPAHIGSLEGRCLQRLRPTGRRDRTNRKWCPGPPQLEQSTRPL